MDILRIETANRVGPYRSDKLKLVNQKVLSSRISYAHDQDSAEHPIPHYDGIDSSQIGEGYVCGFIYDDDAFDWFQDFLWELTDAGFLLRTYRVADDKVLTGGHQCMFEREDAELVDERPPTALIPAYA